MVTFFDPGQMTARLDLERAADVADGQGGAHVAWTAVASLWARIEPASTVIVEEPAAERVRITHRIWVRFREDISVGQRFRKGGRIFAIRAVHDPDETGRYLVCRCEEELR